LIQVTSEVAFPATGIFSAARSWPFFPGHDLFSQSAEGLAGDPEIGGDHVLGDPLDALGIGPDEFQVFGLRRLAHGLQQTPLRGDEVVLNQDAEISFELRHFLQKDVPGGAGDQEQFGVFESLHIKKGGLVGEETVEICGPPAFQGKLQDMFAAFFVNGIGSQYAF